jgi:multidrug efflux pump subunit AcrA (membrane-fusion protein)
MANDSDDPIALIEQLAERLGVMPETVTGLGMHDWGDVARRLRALTQAAQSGDAAQQAEARRAAEELRARLRGKAAADQQRVEQARAQMHAALRAAEQTDLSAIADGLRDVAEWLDGRPGSGARVDEWVEAFERTLGPLFGATAEQREQERESRIRTAARSSIADRLRARGIKPSEDD